jgi:SAM-dependent methyltransferase
VDYDPRDGTYALPPEHAAFLTRAATPANLAVYAQYIPLLGAVEDDVLACFRAGGGVPYARFQRFHEVMAEDSGQTVLPVLKSHILPLLSGLDERLKDGIRVLDVGCGRGRALNILAAWFPNSRFIGIDLSEEAIKFARVEAEERVNKNASFIVRDAGRNS